jgi:hypothetical protein
MGLNSPAQGSLYLYLYLYSVQFTRPYLPPRVSTGGAIRLFPLCTSYVMLPLFPLCASHVMLQGNLYLYPYSLYFL